VETEIHDLYLAYQELRREVKKKGDITESRDITPPLTKTETFKEHNVARLTKRKGPMVTKD